MSGIAGIVYFNGQDVRREDLLKMATAMEYRGPDGIHYFCESCCGFANLILFNTPESKFAQLPDSIEGGKYRIAFQGRLDNREELYRATDFTIPLKEVSDSQLILAAYLKYKDDCTNRLLGDFSFAIWDAPAHRLFCGRDHMGVIPFYYHVGDNPYFFAFASEIKALRTLSQVKTSINDERIADYLSTVITDCVSTFYNGISRLPAAHNLVAGASGVTTRHYGKLEPVYHNYKSDSAFQEHFRELFIDSVRCRLRSARPVGSFLSGGLDSTTIVSVILALLQSDLHHPLQTFSSVFDTIRECDERDYFSAILKRHQHKNHSELLDTPPAGAIFDKMCEIKDEPFFAPHFFSPWNLMIKAQCLGIGTLFDGHDGDTAISHGLGFLNELLLGGHFIRLFRECSVVGTNPCLRSTIGNILRIIRECGYDIFQFTGIRSPDQKIFLNATNYLNSSFATKTNIQERLLQESNRCAHRDRSEQLSHMVSITHPRQQLALEFFEQQGLYFGINVVYPYFDKRIIEFCLGLPAEQKFVKGYNRRIVRDAFADILPGKIRLRKNKTNFNASLYNAFLHIDKAWFSLNLDTMNEATYNYINIEYINRATKTQLRPETCHPYDLFFLLRCLSLSKWLSCNQCKGET